MNIEQINIMYGICLRYAISLIIAAVSLFQDQVVNKNENNSSSYHFLFSIFCSSLEDWCQENQKKIVLNPGPSTSLINVSV